MNNNLDDNLVENSTQSNSLNTQTDDNSNVQNCSKEKKELISTPVLFFIIISLIITGIVILSSSITFKDYNKEKEEVTSKKVGIDKVDNEKSSDIYGYSLMSYMPSQGEMKDSYKIVELHKSGDDKVIQSYDAVIKNAVDQVNRLSINSARIINNKLYYQLYFNASNNGLSTYSNIMYIDLSNINLETVELLKIKPDESNVDKRINSYKIDNDYIFYSTYESENNYYKYDVKSKNTEASSKEEYDSITEDVDKNYSFTGKYYYKGKEIKINNSNEIVYNNTVIYKSFEKGLSIYYSFNDEIFISELLDCEEKSCDTIKYYKLNVDTTEVEEIDYNNYKIFTQKIWYKK